MSSSNTTFDNDAAEEYGIPSEHREILQEYNWKKYETINTDLREGIPNDSAEPLSLAYETLPTFKWEVYRWIYLPTWKYNQIYGWLKEGDVFTEYWFTSSSIDRKRAEWFAWWIGDWYNDESQKSVIMIIKSKNGKYTLNSHEKEIWFNKGTDFRLLRKNENGSYVELYLEEI